MQKFFKGDVVHIAEKLLPEMTPHFPANKLAVVEYSYNQMYGNGRVAADEYSLLVEGEGSTSWYPAEVLTLIIGESICPCCGKARI